MRHRRLQEPTNCHPAVARLFEEMNRQKKTATDIATAWNGHKNTVMNWRRHSPGVDNLEAALNVLGLELTVRERT